MDEPVASSHRKVALITGITGQVSSLVLVCTRLLMKG